ncbi:hypothetical protein QTO34_001746 [Cnephaeus nilssonii]|uniref:Uncharacterized protein n=1 Tax=Cnephaeus nilssonii TaxID=3371016 RepID=A0AA40LMS0_CNENI|nr:hypothetical protein QTO34_001746 [Eptesicus nilssonii]
MHEPSTVTAQTLSSCRCWLLRELSVPQAQSATLATPSPAPCASRWPNRGHSGVMLREGTQPLWVLHGRLEAQVVPLPFGWTSDCKGMECMLALYQEGTAWGNDSSKTISLLFPPKRGKEQENPKMIRPPSSNINYTSCLSRLGEQYSEFMGNLSQCVNG